MEINPIWFSLTVIGLIGMTVNAVKWFILDKDYSRSMASDSCNRIYSCIDFQIISRAEKAQTYNPDGVKHRKNFIFEEVSTDNEQ